MSAMPYQREDGKKLLLNGLLGDVIYNYDAEQLQEDEFGAETDIIFASVGKSKVRKDLHWKSAYKKLIVNNEERNQKICEILNLEMEKGNNAVVLYRQIKHGEVLEKIIKETCLGCCHFRQQILSCEIYEQSSIDPAKKKCEHFKKNVEMNNNKP